MFAYFKCFSLFAWSTIVATILAISIVSKIISKMNTNLYSIGYYIWNYTIILISGTFSKSITRSTPYLILSLVLWLGLNFSILFNAFVVDFMVTTVPIIRVKSLEELSQRKELEIIVRVDSSLISFTEQGKSQLARGLASQLSTYDDFHQEHIGEKLIDDLRDGSVAYISDALLMIFTLISLSQSHDVSFKSVYISRENSELEPYFLLMNKNMPPWAIGILNKK